MENVSTQEHRKDAWGRRGEENRAARCKGERRRGGKCGGGCGLGHGEGSGGTRQHRGRETDHSPARGHKHPPWMKSLPKK